MFTLCFEVQYEILEFYFGQIQNTSTHIFLSLFPPPPQEHKNENNCVDFRPEQAEPVLDRESGLSLVSLPSPVTIKDQKQAKLTQCILDNLGEGLDVGVSGDVVYSQRRGEIKAFWSFSQFDQSRLPQEISKLRPQPLYPFRDFIHGTVWFHSLSSAVWN